MRTQQHHRSHLDGWLLAVVLGVLFVFLELLKTHRSAQWAGTTGQDWQGVGVGLGLYVVVLGGLAECVWVTTRRLTRGRLSSELGLPLCAVLAGGGVWAVLSMHREYAPTLDDALVVLALAGLAAGVAVLPRYRLLTRRSICGAAGTALAAGIAATVASANVALFRPDRTTVVTTAAMAWVGVAGVVGVVAWGFHAKPLARTRRWGLSLLLVALPLLGMYVPLANDRHAGARHGPNLILIVIDTLRADHCSVYGGTCATPSLDALAQRGTRFSRCMWLPRRRARLAAALQTAATQVCPQRVPPEIRAFARWQFHV